MSEVAPRVLVTGATGTVGPRVVEALHESRFRVRILSRTAPETGNLLPKVEVCIGDITDQLAVRSALEGCEAAIHLAALLHIEKPSENFRQRYEQINVGGTANVVDAAIQAGARRVVLFSTISVYGSNTGHVLTEEHIPRPQTDYSHSKLSAEQIVLGAHRRDGRPIGTVLRLGAVYGSRVKGNYKRLLQSLAHHTFIQVGRGSNRRTLVYDKDVARAAVLVVKKPEAAGQVYNVSDGAIHAVSEIIKAMCDSLGRTPPRLFLPVGPAKLAARMLDRAARLIGRDARIVRTALEKYLEDVAVTSDRIQTQLGFVPMFHLASGWRETVLEMRRLGRL